MNIRFATTASAMALAAAGAVPALANEQVPAISAAPMLAAPLLISDAGALTAASALVPLANAETTEELTGVTIAAASEAAPVVITAGAGSATMLTAAAAGPELAIDSSAMAVAAQAGAMGPESRSESWSVVLNQDAFFGFYPTFSGMIPISENMDLSFYGILWTTADFSSGAGQGRDLWTEFGVGVNFYAMDGKLTINPQLGFTNGFLLSQGTDDSLGGNVFDGVVPNLTMNYDDDSFEAEFYGGYYAALRNRNDRGLDFLHTWINAGIKATPNFSVGAHYELLSLTRAAGGNAANIYHWVGPYVQFSLDSGFFARFTGGWDVGENNSGDFYKLAVGFSF
ncbi:MAG: DUF6733 family protein [Erythrobacter sp.]